jgi:hypothetical protein
LYALLPVIDYTHSRVEDLPLFSKLLINNGLLFWNFRIILLKSLKIHQFPFGDYFFTWYRTDDGMISFDIPGPFHHRLLEKAPPI